MTPRALLLLGAGILATGCIVGLRMQPPEDLVGVSEVLEVTGRSQFGRGLLTSEGFDLGPYRVSDVDRDWNKVRGAAKDLWFVEGRKLETENVGGYSFAFGTPEGPLAGVCETAVLSKRYKFGSWSVGEDTQTLGCMCQHGGNVLSSLVVVDAKAGTQWDGWLELGGITYQVKGHRRLEGNKTSAGPAGYRFEGAESPPLGAVDIMNPGRVWLHERLSQEDRAAAGCVAAAILLEPRPAQPEPDWTPDE
jgi:hypothetical protein